MGQLTGKCALVTGGARGLGFATAKAFKAEGAKVAVTDRLEAEGARAVASLGDDVVFLAQDVTKPEEWDRVLDQVVARLGAIDILVNNAGINWPSPAENFPTEHWLRVINVNLNAPFLLAREIARTCMIPRKGGRILNVASVGGLIGNPPQLGMSVAPYNASKGGLISLTRALASEWGRHGINVNALCPGFFITDMSRDFLNVVGKSVLPTVPLGRFGGERDLVGPALLLISAAGRHITGETLVVDGGMISAS